MDRWDAMANVFFVIGLTCQSENVSFMMPVDDDILWAEEVVAWGLAEVTTAPSSSSSSDSFRIWRIRTRRQDKEEESQPYVTRYGHTNTFLISNPRPSQFLELFLPAELNPRGYY